jgi:hypothetical protein
MHKAEEDLFEVARKAANMHSRFGHTDVGDVLIRFLQGDIQVDYAIWAITVDFINLSSTELASPDRPNFQDRVQVGGCCGKIREVTMDTVIVNGMYTYTDGGDEPGTRFSESWEFTYDRRVFACARWSFKDNWWDAQSIKSNQEK